MRIPRITLLLLAVVWASAAGQEFDYAAYRPALLSEVLAGLPHHAPEWLAEGSPRFRTHVVFAGNMRPLSTHRKQFIAKWFASMGYPATEAAVFEQEIEVTQDGVVYRLPIQTVLVEQLKTEVPAGTPLEVYLLLMGSERDQLVFAVSEFDASGDVHAPTDPPPPPAPTGDSPRK